MSTPETIAEATLTAVVAVENGWVRLDDPEFDCGGDSEGVGSDSEGGGGGGDSDGDGDKETCEGRYAAAIELEFHRRVGDVLDAMDDYRRRTSFASPTAIRGLMLSVSESRHDLGEPSAGALFFVAMAALAIDIAWRRWATPYPEIDPARTDACREAMRWRRSQYARLASAQSRREALEMRRRQRRPTKQTYGRQTESRDDSDEMKSAMCREIVSRGGGGDGDTVEECERESGGDGDAVEGCERESGGGQRAKQPHGQSSPTGGDDGYVARVRTWWWNTTASWTTALSVTSTVGDAEFERDLAWLDACRAASLTMCQPETRDSCGQRCSPAGSTCSTADVPCPAACKPRLLLMPPQSSPPSSPPPSPLPLILSPPPSPPQEASAAVLSEGATARRAASLAETAAATGQAAALAAHPTENVVSWTGAAWGFAASLLPARWRPT